jgi:hypothetical protein
MRKRNATAPLGRSIASKPGAVTHFSGAEFCVPNLTNERHRAYNRQILPKRVAAHCTHPYTISIGLLSDSSIQSLIGLLRPIPGA